MPKLSEHQSSGKTNLLIMGDSGAGKTSILGSLANAGYNLYILDFDNGLDTLRFYVDEKKLDNVEFFSIKDEVGGRKATAWEATRDILFKDGWPDKGKPKDWTDKDVLVIDSLTFLGEAAKHRALAVNQKAFDQQMTQAEWGDAVRMGENILDYITSPNLPCHVVVTALPVAVDDDAGISKTYPYFVTKNLSMKVGKFFNNVVGLKARRDGSRYLRVLSEARTDYKLALPVEKGEAEMDADLGILFGKLQKGK